MRALASLLLAAGCTIDTAGAAGTAPADSGAADVGADASAMDAVTPPTDAPPPDVPPGVYTSCEEIRIAHPGATSGGYVIDVDGDGALAPFAVYCEIFTGRAWTLLMKMDGNQATFAYDSPLWTNGETLNQESVDLTKTEAKLRGFDSIPFDALRLVMETATERRTVEIPVSAPSLSALLDGRDQPTSSGAAVWLSLMPDPLLHLYCPTEGINIESGCCARVRIGIIADADMDCGTPDSVIGFGIGPLYACSGAYETSVGNGAVCGPGGPADTRAFGWIFVR